MSLLGVALLGLPALERLEHPPAGLFRIDWTAVQKVAGFIQAETQPGEEIYLYQNPALCLYYLAGRFPPTKVFMDHQLLPENKDAPGLLKEAMASLAARPPKFVIVGNLGRSVPELEAFTRERYSPRTNFGIQHILQRKPLAEGPGKEPP